MSEKNTWKKLLYFSFDKNQNNASIPGAFNQS